MKFEEIFKKPGLYKARGFAKGVCLKVDSDNNLKIVHYEDKDDMNPREENMVVYGGLFKKEYKVVYTRQSLFDYDPKWC